MRERCGGVWTERGGEREKEKSSLSLPVFFFIDLFLNFFHRNHSVTTSVRER